MKKIRTILLILVLLLSITRVGYSQIPPNAVNADPSATEIHLDPISAFVAGTATMVAVLENACVASNGVIPANSCYLTISFPAQYGLASVPTVPGFSVYYTELGPSGTLHLINTVAINEGDVIEARFTVTGFALGSGLTTYNVDRTTPITVANTQTANDNSTVTLTTTSALPLTLLGFTGTAVENCSVKLDWSTATEVNTAFFNIEYSTNGALFEPIGEVNARGTGAGQYSYVTNKGAGSISYYRLKMVDNNGVFKYSPVVVVKANCNAGKDYMTLYPNPVNKAGTVYLSFSTSYRGKANLILTNTLGQQLITSKVQVNAGANVIPVNVEKLSAGTYFVTLITVDDEKIGGTQKIIK
ncbi:T9SS type A sorting domain-containing protein [Ferruginibacter sp.]|nr:T9SS type A sorting domain-containing protein [Ferruginibacter sp.]